MCLSHVRHFAVPLNISDVVCAYLQCVSVFVCVVFAARFCSSSAFLYLFVFEIVTICRAFMFLQHLPLFGCVVSICSVCVVKLMMFS